MGRIRKTVELNEDNVNWFERTYHKGSLNWLLDLLLEKFRNANESTPQQYAEIAALELTDEVRK